MMMEMVVMIPLGRTFQVETEIATLVRVRMEFMTFAYTVKLPPS